MGSLVETLSFNGNRLTELMHFYTLHELKKMHCLFILPLKKIFHEKTAVIGNGQKGSFDFLVETVSGKEIGIEVLTRPSKGKMKQKLSYSKNVDEFIFVIPEHFLENYKIHEKKGFKGAVKKHFLPKEFSSQKLFAWIFDTEKRAFTTKASFSGVFNTAKA